MEKDSMDRLAGFSDVPLDFDAVLDRRLISVRRLLDLKPGSLVLTVKSAGEGAELFLGGVLLGRGDITVTGDALAVRITDFEDGR
jgi:flagellar motor switch/type III secretory pathway protein FliN